MDIEQIRRRRQELIERYGEWTAHTIRLAEDTYTFPEDHPERDRKISLNALHLNRIVQAVADAAGRSLSELRVIDLGCLEGMYAVEFARHGAEVVGVEGRAANLEKARFAQEVLSLDNLRFVQDDVRNLSVEKYGRFDVVLCIGLLYHLDAPEVFEFTERMAEVCNRVAVIDTHFSHIPYEQRTYKGQTYHGHVFTEFTTETEEEKERAAWAALDNSKSFWPTLPSLFNLFADAGFTSAYTCFNPCMGGRWPDRDTFIALKGERRELYTVPSASARWSEEMGLDPSRETIPSGYLARGVRKLRGLARGVVRGRR
jgi:ubiquinone/menaquinone biosynthesis C-methylase UbiE